MIICVCGWYFNPEVYAMLEKLPFTVYVIGNGGIQAGIDEKYPAIEFLTRPNIGLEFGAYQYFLSRIAFLEDGVLFIHDDISVSDPSVFSRIRDLQGENIDQTFLFSDEANAVANQNFHGRAFYCSARFLRAMLGYVCSCRQSHDHVDMHHNRHCSQACAEEARSTGWDASQIIVFTKDDGQRPYRCPTCGTKSAGDFWGMGLRGTGPHSGFWYDPHNNGHHRGKPPVGVRHYNDEIYHFAMFCAHARSPGIDGVRYNSRNVRYFPELRIGKRGVL